MTKKIQMLNDLTIPEQRQLLHIATIAFMAIGELGNAEQPRLKQLDTYIANRLSGDLWQLLNDRVEKIQETTK